MLLRTAQRYRLDRLLACGGLGQQQHIRLVLELAAVLRE
jgi:hypothetical protein